MIIPSWPVLRSQLQPLRERLADGPRRHGAAPRAPTLVRLSNSPFVIVQENATSRLVFLSALLLEVGMGYVTQ